MTLAQANHVKELGKRRFPLDVSVRISTRGNTHVVYMASIFNHKTTTSYKVALDWIK